MSKVYIDLNNLLATSFISGIQRVVREVITRMDSDEVVFLKYEAYDDCFYVVDKKLLLDGLKNNKISDKCKTKKKVTINSFSEGDILFDIDGVWHSTKSRNILYPILFEKKVKIVNMIYDVIPIMRPEYCHEDTIISFLVYFGAVLQYSSLIIANTQATIDNIEMVAKKLEIEPPKGVVAPLGSDFGASGASGESKDLDLNVSKHVKNAVSEGEYVLMVGTIEPRKNHKYLIDALDVGLNTNVIIAGRQGWNVDELISRIKNHKLFGKRLFWINDATDEDIDYLYKNAFCVAFPSYDEGYGLPIIESVMRGIPVVASDIPVLREVGREFAEYTDNDKPEEFVKKIDTLLQNKEAYKELKDKLKNFVPYTWDECAKLIEEYLKRV